MLLGILTQLPSCFEKEKEFLSFSFIIFPFLDQEVGKLCFYQGLVLKVSAELCGQANKKPR